MLELPSFLCRPFWSTLDEQASLLVGLGSVSTSCAVCSFHFSSMHCLPHTLHLTQGEGHNAPHHQQQEDQADEAAARTGEALGRILYVRDSDDGAATDGGLLDSDEDPDDDLDI